MKTYRTPGATATEWSPTGNSQTVSRIETYTNAGGSTIAVPVTLALAGETTKKGVRRVMLKASGSVPRSLMDTSNGVSYTDTGSQSVPFSAHLVVQMPQVVAQVESGGSWSTGILAIVLNLVRDLVAIVSDESTTANSDLSVSGLLARALSGDNALDIISGAYGESTARA